MKEKIIFLGGAILILAVAGALLIREKKPMAMDNSPVKAVLHFTTPITLGGVKLNVAFADTNALLQQGLSGQSELSDEQGMLFDFKNSPRKKPGFWMKEMYIPLDMVWVRDGTVVDIARDVPAPSPDTPLSDLPLYYPSEPIDAVVEVPAGWCERHNVGVGAKLELF